MKEIVEMMQNLLEMQTDTYMMCKYTLLLVSRDYPGIKKFVEELFDRTDRKRPLLITAYVQGSRMLGNVKVQEVQGQGIQ